MSLTLRPHYHRVLSRRTPDRSGFKANGEVKSLLLPQMEPQSIVTQPVTCRSTCSEGFDERPQGRDMESSPDAGLKPEYQKTNGLTN